MSQSCPTCGESVFYCPCPKTVKELEQADKSSERYTGYSPSTQIPTSLETVSDVSKFNEKPIRAKSYGVVATGPCPTCHTPSTELRFCYNPYGSDVLICTDCADAQDSYFAEHSGNNH